MLIYTIAYNKKHNNYVMGVMNLVTRQTEFIRKQLTPGLSEEHLKHSMTTMVKDANVALKQRGMK